MAIGCYYQYDKNRTGFRVYIINCLKYTAVESNIITLEIIRNSHGLLTGLQIRNTILASGEPLKMTRKGY